MTASADEMPPSGRMFVEGRVSQAGLRDDAQRLMRELDMEAAERGRAVVGDVTVMTYEHGLLGNALVMRLEADTEPR